MPERVTPFLRRHEKSADAIVAQSSEGLNKEEREDERRSC